MKSSPSNAVIKETGRMSLVPDRQSSSDFIFASGTSDKTFAAELTSKLSSPSNQDTRRWSLASSDSYFAAGWPALAGAVSGEARYFGFSPTYAVIQPIFYDDKSKEAQRQIARISPIAQWVRDGKNAIVAKENFETSVQKATEILMRVIPTTVPIPIASADIESGSSLFLDDERSYVDVEIDGSNVEFYVKCKKTDDVFYGEEEMQGALIPPKLFSALLHIYAINK